VCTSVSPRLIKCQHNLEGQRRQYGLVNRARALGWQEIDVIDDDLGVSGSGTRRAGFERLLRALCDGQVGAVFRLRHSGWLCNGPGLAYTPQSTLPNTSDWKSKADNSESAGNGDGDSNGH